MTREEAIEAVKAKMDYYESDKRLRAALETLIPELAEVKEERIRKSLVDCVSYFSENRDIFSRHDVTKEQVLAYLENMKDESISSDIRKGFWYACTRDVYIDGKLAYIKGNIVNSDDFMFYLDASTAATAFHRVFFPNNDEEKFCDHVLHPWSSGNNNK